MYMVINHDLFDNIESFYPETMFDNMFNWN